MYHWLLQTNAGLIARAIAGALIFATLAIVDVRRNGSRATRWREYGVLLAAVAAALVYGGLNDQVTVTISPEYFLYGKELTKVVGDPPSSAFALHWAAAQVGFMATWSAGLIFGVVLLLANNPWRSLPRLRNRQLVALLPWIVLTAIAFGVVGGLLGYAGAYTHWSDDFEGMVRINLWRPRRFMATWGVHLGGYVGGFIGVVGAAVWVVRTRFRSSD